MSQQVYMQQSNKVEQRQNPRQQESQHQNLCSEWQKEIYSIRKETAKIKQEHLKLKEQLEERNLELQECLRTQTVLNENLLDIHVQNENTRVKIKNKEEALLKLMQKRNEVEEICSTIQDLCDPLSSVLIDIVQAKEEVIRYNNVTQENLEKLKEKFKHISNKGDALKQNLNSIALNEGNQLEKETARKMKEIALSKDTLHTLWNQLQTLQKELNTKKEDISVTEKENINRKNENDNVLENLKKQIQIEEELYDSQTGINNSLIKQVEEMEINHKHVVEEIDQGEADVAKLKSDLAELQLKSKTFNEELELKKKRYEKVQENVEHMKVSLEMCESEVETVKLHSEEQASNLHTAKEELQNTVALNKQMKEQTVKLHSQLEEKLLQVEEQKFTAVREVEELKATIKTTENEFSNSLIDLQRTREQLTELEGQYQQLGDLQIQIQQENELLQTEHASNLEQLEQLNTTIGHKNAETEGLFSLLGERQTELRQFSEDVDKTQRKYDEAVAQREREKLEVDLELKNAIKEMEKTEANCHWIMEQTMACVDSCKQNYAKHLEDKKEELQSCKAEKLLLAKKLSDVCAEKEECKIKLENEVLELEKTVTELEIKLKKELETSPTILGSPAPLAKTQAKQQQSTTAPLEKFTYKEPRKPLTDSGHPPVPFTEDSKKQAVKRKQTETHIAFFKPKVPSAHDKEVLSQLLEVPKTSERQLRNKFFKTKCNTNAVGKTPNVVDDFDYYKFD